MGPDGIDDDKAQPVPSTRLFAQVLVNRTPSKNENPQQSVAFCSKNHDQHGNNDWDACAMCEKMTVFCLSSTHQCLCLHARALDVAVAVDAAVLV